MTPGSAAIEAGAAVAGVPVDRQWLEWNPQRQGIQLRLMLEPFRADVVRATSTYLREWARRLGVEEELAYVLGGGTFDVGDSQPTP